MDSTNVTHSPVVLTDTFGNAMEYQRRVRAIAEASARPGPWSDTVTLTMTQDTEPPNTPSMPGVSTDLRIITVDIDGLDEFGEAMPVDYNHTRIYFAAAEGMAGAEMVGTLSNPGLWNSGSMAPGVPVWVAVSAVDHVGNESTMTLAQSVTPRKLVDDSSIRDELGTIDDKINTAVDDLNQAIGNIVIDDAGIATYWMPTEPDETTEPPPKTGFLWFDTSDGSKLYRFDGQKWVSAADERIQAVQDAQERFGQDITEAEQRAIDEARDLADQARADASVDATSKANSARDEAVADAEAKDADLKGEIDSVIDGAVSDLSSEIATVRTSVDGKNRITQSISTPPKQYDGAVGDRWERMSSMGSGGRLVSNWRWNGTVWVSTLIGDAVLGNVDASKIGTGYLEADRIESGTITADKILVGAGRNIIPWAQVLAGETVRPHFNWGYYGAGTLAPAPADAAKGVPGHAVHQRTTSDPDTDRYIIKLNPDVWTGGNTDKFPVSGGTWSLSVRGYTDSANLDARLTLIWYHADGAYGATGTSAPLRLGTQPKRIEVSLELPDDAAYMVAGIRTNQPGETHWVNPELALAVGATLIEDGAVTTSKVAAGAIEAGKIAAGAIEADHIKAGAIVVGTVDGLQDSLDSKETPSGAQSKADAAQSSAVSEAEQNAGDRFGETKSLVSGWRVSGQTSIAGGSIAADSITSAQIAADAITANKIAADAIGATAIAAGVIDADHIIAGGIQADSLLVAGSVGATLIEDGAITTDKILAGAITAESGIIGSINAGTIKFGEMDGARIKAGTVDADRVVVEGSVGATLIEDGAITTDKILANAITAGKIAALAIEADHISANAITADKIRAGAIDGKLITGARIRTAASGRRTELDVEGLTSYNSSGKVVLTTDTADGSIDMTGRLSQTSGGTTIEVGGNYLDGPGIKWTDSNIYAYPPGVAYGTDSNDSSKMRTFIQGPGVTGGNSYLNLLERGEGFTLESWQTSGDNSWIVKSDVPGNLMRIGSNISDAPYMYFKRGSGDTGAAFVGYRHPNGVGYSSMALRDSYAYIGAYNWQGNLMGSLRMDASGTALNSGTRNMYLYGNEIGINADGGIWLNHNAIYMNSLPSDSGASEIGRVNGRIHSLYSSRKYKLMEEPIESTVDDFEGKLMSVDAKTWVDRTRADRIADHMTAIENGEKPTEPLEDIGGLERIPGIVAEDLHDAGLGLFVGYDNEGEPQSVLYSRIGPALIPIIRRLRDRVDALETQLGESNAA
ncbi:hypothetical protein [Brevibacterium aurantiacum]|uniref:hypothetical protein n=1 Tax=Brevibacterium aurantiacum TaxID=273384 RepID=UPI000F6524AB|nr:hypothetical protein [Brevibacterium aurantiacum]AZL08584.1 hypothetical protein CXR26_04525 [Brevibacterium aurantiacum]